MGFLYLSSPKSAVPFLPYSSTVYGRVFIVLKKKKKTPERIIGPIYTRDGSSVWDELGQRTVVRLIIRLCINTGFQTDHPSRRIIHVSSSVKTNYRELP